MRNSNIRLADTPSPAREALAAAIEEHKQAKIRTADLQTAIAKAEMLVAGARERLGIAREQVHLSRKDRVDAFLAVAKSGSDASIGEADREADRKVTDAGADLKAVEAALADLRARDISGIDVMGRSIDEVSVASRAVDDAVEAVLKAETPVETLFADVKRLEQEYLAKRAEIVLLAKAGVIADVADLWKAGRLSSWNALAMLIVNGAEATPYIASYSIPGDFDWLKARWASLRHRLREDAAAPVTLQAAGIAN